jgi:F-type H+-transporting ATPase subunit b
MKFDATFWVGLSFLVFVGLMIYFKVHKMIIDGLDERSKKIAKELEEAQRLREEAQALLATYERKQRDAVEEAEAMLQHAREEARREAEIAAAKLEEALERREALSLEKIRMAEAQAEKEVRDAAIDAAIEAARQVIESKLDQARAGALVDDAIGDLRRHLN